MEKGVFIFTLRQCAGSKCRICRTPATTPLASGTAIVFAQNAKLTKWCALYELQWKAPLIYKITSTEVVMPTEVSKFRRISQCNTCKLRAFRDWKIESDFSYLRNRSVQTQAKLLQHQNPAQINKEVSQIFQENLRLLEKLFGGR